MLTRAGKLIRYLQRVVSRSEWASRLLRLSHSRDTAVAPGLLMIQIDGLSRRQLYRAMWQGRLPFLRQLVHRQRYTIHPLYSGLPASTPAFQAELFYGLKSAVPAFSFFDRRAGRIFTMYRPKDAAEIEGRLAARGEGLLRGGSAYTNILTGGADEPHYCAAGTAWTRLLRTINPLILPILALLYLDRILITVALMAIEIVLSLLDCIHGLLTGKTLFEELTFVLSRAAMVILLRELVVIGAKIDLARGLPVVSVNFVGYDEQAHRRGPSSRFAHWTLRGIDLAIARLWRAAHRSSRREFDVWILSDHGQEDSVPYALAHGRPVAKAVTEAFETAIQHHEPVRQGPRRMSRLRYLMRSEAMGPMCSLHHAHVDEIDPERIVLTSMGSLGHIYPPRALSPDECRRVAEALVGPGHIPLVLAADGPDAALAWTAEGRVRLPEQAQRIFGIEHPYLREIAHDLVAVCHHEDAGALVMSGWRRGQPSISFPIEHGSHTGPGLEETNAFALLPADAPLPLRNHAYLRALDLREAVQRLLGRSVSSSHASGPHPAPAKRLRVMTYNVHSCMGMDGKISTDRIARIIARQDPDVVALQEIDVDRARTGSIDQAQAIAQKLKMTFHFQPAIRLARGQYGNAILSRYPMRLVKADRLPGRRNWPDTEPRGAIWVQIDVHGTLVQCIASHLSIWPRERLLQIAALLGPEWLTHPSCAGPVIFCGDLNATPSSRVCQRLGGLLQDAQCALESHRPLRTWSGWYPMSRIDHVFVGPKIEVMGIDVPHTQLETLASDHLPLVVDVRIERELAAHALSPSLASRA